MDARSIVELLVKVWDGIAAGFAWICVWGWIGHLVGDKKKRPYAGAWLGFLLGPFGIALISVLEDRSQQPIRAPVFNADVASKRVRIRRPGDPTSVPPPKVETELEEFNRRFAELNSHR